MSSFSRDFSKMQVIADTATIFSRLTNIEHQKPSFYMIEHQLPLLIYEHVKHLVR